MIERHVRNLTWLLCKLDVCERISSNPSGLGGFECTLCEQQHFWIGVSITSLPLKKCELLKKKNAR